MYNNQLIDREWVPSLHKLKSENSFHWTTVGCFCCFWNNSVIKLRKIRCCWAFVIQLEVALQQFCILIWIYSEVPCQKSWFNVHLLAFFSGAFNYIVHSSLLAVIISALSGLLELVGVMMIEWNGWKLQKRRVSGPWVRTVLWNFCFQGQHNGFMLNYFRLVGC